MNIAEAGAVSLLLRWAALAADPDGAAAAPSAPLPGDALRAAEWLAGRVSRAVAPHGLVPRSPTTHPARARTVHAWRAGDRWRDRHGTVWTVIRVDDTIALRTKAIVQSTDRVLNDHGPLVEAGPDLPALTAAD